MPDFAYTARSLSGQLVEGTLSAGNQREALASLTAKDLFPVQVKAADKRAVANGSSRVKSKHIAPVYLQLASLLRSGVPMLRSLEVIEQQSSNPALKQVMEDVGARVADGETLSDAMTRHPRAFPELATSIIRAGGEGGFLEDSLEQVANFTDQADELRAKVLGAMVYPIVLVIIGAIVVNGLIIFAVPMVEKMFDSRADLPLVTRGLLTLSDTLRGYGLFLLVGLGAAAYAFRQWAESDGGRMTVDRLRTRLPIFGPIYLNLAVGRFCRILGTLLRGGVPIVRSLEIAASSTGNRVLTGIVEQAADNISSGEPLADPLRASGAFPSDVVEMIAVAEQSNNLEAVLEQVANSLEKTTWRKIEVLVRLIEPLLLVALSGIVLLVALALLLPIIEKSTGI